VTSQKLLWNVECPSFIHAIRLRCYDGNCHEADGREEALCLSLLHSRGWRKPRDRMRLVPARSLGVPEDPIRGIGAIDIEGHWWVRLYRIQGCSTLQSRPVGGTALVVRPFFAWKIPIR
jgi:hypothetical protein